MRIQFFGQVLRRLAAADGYTTWEWLGGGAAIAALFLALAQVMGAIDMTTLAQAVVDWMASALTSTRP